jgi:hypothetical protein
MILDNFIFWDLLIVAGCFLAHRISKSLIVKIFSIFIINLATIAILSIVIASFVAVESY